MVGTTRWHRIVARAALAVTALATAFPTLAGADGHEMAAGDADVFPFVIKVTPTLVYLDSGEAMGSVPGQMYLIVRFGEDGSQHWVGEAKVIRTFLDFCIAEIVSTVEGEQIEILQRAISMERWQAMAAMPAAGDRPAVAGGSRFLYVLAGYDLSMGVDLTRLANGDVVSLDSEPALGLRLGNFLGDNWRLNLTYRMAGRPLSAGDVTHLSLDVDMHFLFRGRGKAGSYVGFGAGGHRFSWEADRPLPDSASKIGFNLMGGLEFPFAESRWSFMIESGYQWVDPWGTERIDASNVHAYLGLGRNF